MARSIHGKFFTGMVALMLAVQAYGADSDAKPANPPAKVQRCIQIARIDHTKVIDDQNVVFIMRDHKVYKNHLPARCTGLSQYNAFSFATSLSQLCNVDMISVLNQTTGQAVPGASCSLGHFELSTEKESAKEKQQAQAN